MFDRRKFWLLAICLLAGIVLVAPGLISWYFTSDENYLTPEVARYLLCPKCGPQDSFTRIHIAKGVEGVGFDASDQVNGETIDVQPGYSMKYLAVGNPGEAGIYVRDDSEVSAPITEVLSADIIKGPFEQFPSELSGHLLAHLSPEQLLTLTPAEDHCMITPTPVAMDPNPHPTYTPTPIDLPCR